MFSHIVDYLLQIGYIFYPIFLVGISGWFYLLKVFFPLWEQLKISKSDKSFNSNETPSQLKSRQTDDLQANCITSKLEIFKANLKTVKMLALIAPILGLLGTVNGIVDTFKVIATYGNTNPNLMADGISKALLTTQLGLTISFPLLLGLVLCQNQLKKLKLI